MRSVMWHLLCMVIFLFAPEKDKDRLTKHGHAKRSDGARRETREEIEIQKNER